MPFDTSTRLYSLLAERIKVPIRNEKRSDTNCIKPIFTYGAPCGNRTRIFGLGSRCSTTELRVRVCYYRRFSPLVY